MPVKKGRHTIAVLGAGNFGTAFSHILAENGHRVHLWNWEEDVLPLKQIKKYRENKKYLKGVRLAEDIHPMESVEDAVSAAQFVFFALPSAHIRYTIRYISSHIPDGAILVDLSKGVEPHTLELIPYILSKHVRPKLKKNIVTISGPSVASQMARGGMTLMNIASKNKQAMKRVKKVVENNHIQLVPTTDVVGVEVGGSFKNVYAIGMGICDGLGMPLNTKAALITYATEEIAVLAKAMGGKKETMYDLAGLGDLVGTALADSSRNREFGECIGKGMTSKQACTRVFQTIEGISAAECLMRLKKKYHLSLPFTELIYSCIKGNVDIPKAFQRFLRSV